MVHGHIKALKQTCFSKREMKLKMSLILCRIRKKVWKASAFTVEVRALRFISYINKYYISVSLVGLDVKKIPKLKSNKKITKY